MPCRVRRRERRGDLDGDVERLGDARAPRGEPPAQRHPVDELGGDVVQRLRAPDFVDRHDVRVVERRGGQRLLLETSNCVAPAGQLRRHHLEGDGPAQFSVAREVDLTHPPPAEQQLDLVAAYPLTARERLLFSVGSCRQVDGLPSGEVPGKPVRGQKRFDLAAHLSVGTADIGQEVSALFGRAPQGCVEDPFYLLPAFSIHNVSSRFETCERGSRESHPLGKVYGAAKTCHPRREKNYCRPPVPESSR